MSYLDDVVDISEIGQRKLVVLWGKSNTGKTELGSTWPKPQLYIQVGDDGSNTISEKSGIKSGKRIESVATLRDALKDLIKVKGGGYKSVFIDTFSMLTNVWTDENAVKKKKKMTQQMWGDLKIETEEIIQYAHKLAAHTWVILSCHEAMDTVEGLEDEILPDARPSITRGARTYLEGMANYGFHTTRLEKVVNADDGTEKTLARYALHVGPNPYYWTKLQIPKGIKVPSVIVNPSYSKLAKLGLMGEKSKE